MILCFKNIIKDQITLNVHFINVTEECCQNICQRWTDAMKPKKQLKEMVQI